MTITINGTTGIAGVDGSAATPSVQGADTNTGIFYGTDIVAISTGGTERVRVNASGNVGIGTTTPNAVLEVNGGAAASSIKITNSSYPTTGLDIVKFAVNADAIINLVDSGSLRIYTANTERMRIDSSGNVGIGTTSSTGNLTIGGVAPRLDFLESDGSAGFNNTTLIRDADVFAIQTRNGSTFVSNDYRITANASGALTHEWRIANTERMRIDSSGNLLFNSGYGSAATAYGCRAWVNFNGTGTVAIRASGNVTSITDNGAGDYTVNFTTTLPDVNYSCVCSGSQADFASINHAFSIYDVFAPTTSSVRLINQSSNGGNADLSYANVAIFR